MTTRAAEAYAATPPVRLDFDILRAAHAEYVVTDLDAARHFYVDLLGFVLTEATSDALYLRGYEERVHHSLVLRRGDTPHVSHIAFRVCTPGCLDALERRFGELGLPAQRVKAPEAGLDEALRVQDPLGFCVEFFCDIAAVESLMRRFDLHRGAHMMRLDHFNLHVPDVQEGFEHYRSLGFRLSEYTVAADEQLWAAWLYRKPNVHDVALTNGDGPRLHHLGFWVQDTAAVLRTCDILAAAHRAGAIERGPGRHGVSNAFFLYLRDPDGHRIELYTGDYYTGDPDLQPLRWTVDDPRRGTFWGHAAPASWFEESSAVADLQGRLVPVRPEKLSDRPQTVT